MKRFFHLETKSVFKLEIDVDVYVTFFFNIILMDRSVFTMSTVHSVCYVRYFR